MTERVHRILSRRQVGPPRQDLFTNKTGGPRGYDSQSIRKALKRAGLSDCTIHTLRHTHASRLIQNGLSLYEVKEILGHSDIKTTMRYVHYVAEHAQEAVRQAEERQLERLKVSQQATNRQHEFVTLTGVETGHLVNS